MAGRVAHDPETRPDMSDDTRSIPFARERVRRWMEGPVVPPERWLHAETVDELRATRARLGLPVPNDLPSVTRAPLTVLGPLRANLRSLARGTPTTPKPSVRTLGAHGVLVALSASLAAVLGLGAGIALGVIAYAGHLPIPGA